MRRLIKAFGHLLAPTSKRFYAELENPQQAQFRVQQRLVNQLKRCEYGKKHKIREVADWTKLPIVDYEEVEPWIARSKHESNILTTKPILFYEPTSGSSGPIKQIPYTRSLRRSFNRLFCIWAYDLIQHGPDLSNGKLYFSITPSFTKAETTAGTTTTDDSDYLDVWIRWLLKPFLVLAPPTQTPEDFQDALAQTLLLAEKLEIVSIWSPSFLTAQLDYIQTHQHRLHALLNKRLSQARAELLLQPSINWAALWPNLKLLSCWDSVTAADGADSLRTYFPNALVQGKGLLATEAPITVPLLAAKGFVPLLEDVYFEFEDSEGHCYELHQLKAGHTYAVIISQMGGLYRYRLGDFVRVTHYYRQTPCLEFCGRGNQVSDLTGEKLHVQFVSDVLSQLNISEARFQSLVPVRQPSDHYVLLLDRCNGDLDAIAHQLEDSLCQSYHYQLARQLGQLSPVKVIASPTIAKQLSDKKATFGQRWGDVKHTKLSTQCYDELNFLSKPIEIPS